MLAFASESGSEVKFFTRTNFPTSAAANKLAVITSVAEPPRVFAEREDTRTPVLPISSVRPYVLSSRGNMGAHSKTTSAIVHTVSDVRVSC